MVKLSQLPNQYTFNFVSDYYRKHAISENFKFILTAEDTLFKLLENMEVKKAVRTDQISRKFLKDGTQILRKSFSELRSLSMALRSFSNACKIAIASIKKG